MATLSTINTFTTLKEDTAFNVSYLTLKNAANEDGTTTGFKINALAAGSKLSYTTTAGTVVLTAAELADKDVVFKSDGGLYIDGAKVATGFKWLPPQDANGTGKEMFSVSAVDSSGNTTQTAPVWAKGNIAAVNDAPVVETGAALEKTAAEGQTVTLTKAELLALFKNVDGDTLSITSVKVGDTVLEADANGNYSYTAPDVAASTDKTISVTVSDGVVGSAPATFSAGKLTISPLNEAPQVKDGASVDKTINEDDTVSFTAEELLGQFTDADAGDELSIQSVTINGQTVEAVDGVFSYTPAANVNGKQDIVVKVQDAAGDTATLNGKLTITAVNDAPTVLANANVDRTITEEGTLILSRAELLAMFDDVDGDELDIESVTINGVPVAPDGDGNYVYTPVANVNGEQEINVVVTDGQESAEKTGTLTISPVNDAPEAKSDANTQLDTLLDGYDTEGEALSLAPADLAKLFKDADGETLSIKTVTVNGVEVSVGSDGKYDIAGALAKDFNGKVTIEVTAQDPSGETASVSKEVTLGNDFADSQDFTGSQTEGSAATKDVATVTLSAETLDKGDSFTVIGFTVVVGEDGDTLNELALALVAKITQAYAAYTPPVNVADWFTMDVIDGSITFTAVSPDTDLSVFEREDVVFASNATGSETTSSLEQTGSEPGAESVEAQQQSALIALGANDFQPGEVITVKLDGQNISYTVQAGDTLDAIGAKLEQQIAAANGVNATAAYDADSNTLSFVAKVAGTGFELGVETTEIKTTANTAPALEEVSAAEAAVAQVSTLSFADGYAPKAGDTVELKVGSDTLSYTILDGDTVADIVTGLKAQTLDGYILGVNGDGQLTITANSAGAADPLGAAIGLAAYQNNQVDASEDQAAAAEVAAVQQVSTVTFDLSGGATAGMDANETFTVSVNGVDYTYTAANSGITLPKVIAGLKFVIDQDESASVTAAIVDGKLVLTAKEAGTGFTLDAGSNGSEATPTANQPYVAPVAQQTAFDLGVKAYDAGDVVTLTLDGTDYSYTVQAGDTVTGVAAGLKAALPAGFSGSITGKVLTVSAAPGQVFTAGQAVVNASPDSAIGSVSTTTEGSNAEGAVHELKLAADYDAGDVIELNIDGETVNYTVTGGENIAQALADRINNAHAGVSASVDSNGKLLISQAAGPAVTISTGVANHGYADNKLTVDQVDPADVSVPLDAKQTQSITIVSDVIDAGDTYTITFAGAGEGGDDLVIEYTAGPGESAAQVAENLATLVNAEAAPAIATVEGGKITLTARDPGESFSASAGVVGVQEGTDNRLVAGNTVDNVAPNKQSATLELSGDSFDAGDVLSVTVGGHAYSYTVETQGMSKAEVAAKLAAQLNTEVQGGTTTGSAGIFEEKWINDGSQLTYSINVAKLYAALNANSGKVTIDALGKQDGGSPQVPAFDYAPDMDALSAAANDLRGANPDLSWQQAFDTVLMEDFRAALDTHWGAVTVPAGYASFKFSPNDNLKLELWSNDPGSEGPLSSAGSGWSSNSWDFGIDPEAYDVTNIQVGVRINGQLLTLGAIPHSQIEADPLTPEEFAPLLAQALNALVQAKFGTTLTVELIGVDGWTLQRNPDLADAFGELLAGMAGPDVTVTTTVPPLTPNFDATVDADGNIVLTGKTESDSFGVSDVGLTDATNVSGSLAVNHNTDLDSTANTPKAATATVTFDDSYDVGDVVQLTVNGMVLTVTVAANTDVTAALKAAIEGMSNCPVNVSRDGNTLTLTEKVQGDGSYANALSVDSGITEVAGSTLDVEVSTAGNVAGQQTQVAIATVTLADETYDAGDTVTVRVNGTDYSVTLTAPADKAAVQTLLLAKLNDATTGLSTSTAKIEGGELVITGKDAATSLTASTTVSDVAGQALQFEQAASGNVAGKEATHAFSTFAVTDRLDAGDSVVLTVGGTSYTVNTAGLERNEVENELIRQVNADASATVTASYDSVGRLQLTAKQAEAAMPSVNWQFNNYSAHNNDATATLTTEAKAGVTAVKEVSTVVFNNATPQLGDSYSVKIGETTYTYTVASASVTMATVINGLVSKIKADPNSGMSALRSANKLVLSGKEAGVDYTIAASSSDTYNGNSITATVTQTTAPVAGQTASAQVSTLDLAKDNISVYDKGDTVIVSVAGKVYSHTVLSNGVTADIIAAQLAAEITADGAVTATVNENGQLVLTGKQPGVSFTVTDLAVNDAIFTNGAIGYGPGEAGAAAVAEVEVYDLANVQVGDKLTVTIGDTDYTVTVTHGQSAGDAAAALLAKINADTLTSGVRASYATGKLTLTGKADGTSFDASVGNVEQQLTDNSDGAVDTDSNPNVAIATAQKTVLLLSGEIKAGDKVVFRLNDQDVEVIVGEGDDLDDLGAELVAAVTALEDVVSASYDADTNKLTLTGKADGSEFTVSDLAVTKGADVSDQGAPEVNVEQGQAGVAAGEVAVETLSGTALKGDVVKIKVTLDGVEKTFTVTADNGDSESGLAQQLADQIRADADFADKLTVKDKEGRITLTAKDTSTDIDATLSVDKVQATDNNLIHNSDKDVANDANGIVASATVTIDPRDAGNAIEVGDGFSVKFKLNGVDKTASYYVQDGDAGDDWQTVLGTLADRINDAGAGKLLATVVAEGGSWQLVIAGKDATVDFELLEANGTGATVHDNTKPETAQQLQYTVGLGDQPYDVGDELVLQVASGDKTAVIRHLVTPNDALNGADLLAEVKAKLDATWGSEAPLSVSLVGNQLVFTGKQPGDVFNVTGTVNNVSEQDNALHVTAGTANVVGKPGSPFSTTLTLTDADTLDKGDVVKLHFKQGDVDTELSYTVTGSESDLYAAIDTAFEAALAGKANLATTLDHGSIKLAFSDNAAFTLAGLAVDKRAGGADDSQDVDSVYVAGEAATADTLSFTLSNVLADHQLKLAFDADGSALTTNDQHTLTVDVTAGMTAGQLATALQGVWASDDDIGGKIDGVALSVDAGVVTLSGDNFSASLKLVEHNFNIVPV